VRVRDDALALSTMLFHDEVRPADRIPTGGKKPTRSQVERAVAVIEELSTDWEPERYTDCYRERLKRVIDRKRNGERIKAPTPEKEPAPVPDLMAALERTLENVRRGQAPRQARDGDGREELEGLSRDELYERAQKEHVPGRSKMSRKELVEALAESDSG
jgi:DNA end-binding protein Ku